MGRRACLLATTALVLVSGSAHVRAAPGERAAPPPEAAPAAERTLWLRFEGPWTPAAAGLTESDLRTAFGRRGVQVGRTSEAATPGRRPLLTIAVENEKLERIALAFQATTEAPLTRRLNLESFPPDGRVLALIVAADELLAAATAQGLWRKAAPDATPPAKAIDNANDKVSTKVESQAEARPEATVDAKVGAMPETKADTKPETKPEQAQPAPTVVASARGPGAPSRASVGAAFAFERFTGGQTHLGPNLGGTYNIAERWFVSFAAEGRQGRTVSNNEGRVTSRLLGARLASGLRVLGDGAPLAITADVGVRAGRLSFEGQPASPDGMVVGRQVGTWSIVSDLSLALDARLGRRSPVSIRVAASAGVPLLAQVAADPMVAITAASGLVFGSQAGIVLHF